MRPKATSVLFNDPHLEKEEKVQLLGQVWYRKADSITINVILNIHSKRRGLHVGKNLDIEQCKNHEFTRRER